MYTVNDPFVGQIEVGVDITKTNMGLRIQLWDDCGPYATLSVLPECGCEHLKENMAFIDVNNCSWAEQFLITNGLAKPVGIFGESGYCLYPLYEFICEDKRDKNEENKEEPEEQSIFARWISDIQKNL